MVVAWNPLRAKTRLAAARISTRRCSLSSSVTARRMALATAASPSVAQAQEAPGKPGQPAREGEPLQLASGAEPVSGDRLDGAELVQTLDAVGAPDARLLHAAERKGGDGVVHHAV